MAQVIASGEESMYPILVLPKRCTNLETNCEITDNLYIHVNITSPDTDGNPTCIYTGYCNIKMMDVYGVNIKLTRPSSEEADIEIVMNGEQENPAQMWREPSSPQTYNYDVTESRELYSVRHQSHTSITVEQHKTFITKNVYKEAVFSANDEMYSIEEFDQKNRQLELNQLSFQDDTFDCGLFLTQLPEEIINEEQNRDREDCKYIDLESDNSALKQLMSSDIQSTSRQRKTILYLGPDSESGQTIQQIGYYDPRVECSGELAEDVDESIIEGTIPHQKRYQCLQCRQIFEHIAAYREHMGHHDSHKYGRQARRYRADGGYSCDDCGKVLKSREKFELHCMGHGDPDLECDKCRKVFASKFTLRVHKKIHSRKHRCPYCSNRTYSNSKDLKTHITKSHQVYCCSYCDYVTENNIKFQEHTRIHERRDSSETELAESISILDDVMSDDTGTDPDWKVEQQPVKYERMQEADSVIAKVISNKMFLDGSEKRNKKCRKICDVCLKSFDRISDLKRHLIEHIVRSTLAKTPATSSGSLFLTCEVCQVAVFTQIDRYKAHLREHAKLTLYKCTFCNKSFSDSSNFSKHKKIHGAPYFQCDLCQRKFNSKKMITQHMELHNRNEPISCSFCDKVFHFESMLNKHIKSVHSRNSSCRFRCRFCHATFKTLKEKWDHEWSAHNVRKMIVDCLICDAKFRKYAELKKHCVDEHNIEIPTAKRLLKKNVRRSYSSEEDFD